MIQQLIKKCNSTLSKNQQDFKVKKLRAALFNASKFYDESIADLDSILLQNSKDETLLFLRSDCHLKKGNYDLAKKDYVRALKVQFPKEHKMITEQVIENMTVNDGNEISNIKKVVKYEVLRFFARLSPQFEALKKM